MTRPPTTTVNATSAATLTRREAERQPSNGVPVVTGRRAPAAHQRDHREEVFDDQPADRDVAGLACEDRCCRTSTRISTTVLATASARPRTRPADQSQPNARASSGAEAGRDRALRDRARDGDAPHREQLLDVELQADAEHQEDDADLGELLGEGGIGHEAGRVRPDQRAGEQVADDGREAEAAA